MHAILTTVLVALAALTSAHAQKIGGDCAGQPNSQLAIDMASPTLERSVANGALYAVPLAGSNVTLQIAHLYGTPFEMGQAHGELLKETVVELVDNMYKFMDEFVEAYIHMLPEWLQTVIAEAGVDAALEMERLMTGDHVPEYVKEEIRGLAAGSGVPYGRILGVNLIPELVKAHCTLIGAWGDATIKSTSIDGGLVQVRALDWTMAGPMMAHPLITVFHPAEGGGNDFLTLGWPAFVGALTGFNGKLGLGEKVWLNYEGKSTRFGEPWNLVTRDVLQFETTVDGALQRLDSSKRTCSVFLGIGAPESNPPYTLCEYAYPQVLHYNDTNFQSTNAKHPQFNDVVYVDKHTQPTTHTCVGELLRSQYGNLSPETFIRQILPAEESGNLHAAVMDFANGMFYASLGLSATEPAYSRPWVKLDATELLERPL